jgi:hypothetical protein
MIRSLLITLALASPAGAFNLGFPLRCDLGKTCYIQQYIDHDTGPKAADFTCGSLSYDGHDGTDLALPTRAAMQAGVDVLAAQAGTVKGLRDGVADFAPILAGKECGNGVLLDHGDGWETQYCHLKQGSISVRLGEVLAQGDVLGQVGQSGMADFPHLHLALRHNGVTVDPFAPDPLATCGPQTASLWQETLPYVAGGLLQIGIATAVPDYAAIKAGLQSRDLPQTAPALVLWAYFYGVKPGDAILFELTGPAGHVLQERSVIEKSQALGFRATGRRLKTKAWPQGHYEGTARLMRGATELGRQSLGLELTP